MELLSDVDLSSVEGFPFVNIPYGASYVIDGGGFTLSAASSSALKSLFHVESGASLELRNIVLTNKGGRAVYVESGGTLIAGEGCVFKGNTGADYGGAVYNYGGTCSGSDCKCEGNTPNNIYGTCDLGSDCQ